MSKITGGRRMFQGEQEDDSLVRLDSEERLFGATKLR